MNAGHNTCRASRVARRRRASAAALGALLLVAAGCRSVTVREGALSPDAVRLEFPLVRQDALYDCGLASISALCQYWGVEVPDELRTNLARTAIEQAGLSGAELCTALESLGLEVYLVHGSLDRSPTGVYSQLDAGRPLLVMLSDDGTRHHYGLVLGYDEPRGNLILLDPTRGEVLMPVPVFETHWMRCERFTLLACKRGPQPPALNPHLAREVSAEPLYLASRTPRN